MALTSIELSWSCQVLHAQQWGLLLLTTIVHRGVFHVIVYCMYLMQVPKQAGQQGLSSPGPGGTSTASPAVGT
jgi:hypothetical protein